MEIKDNITRIRSDYTYLRQKQHNYNRQQKKPHLFCIKKLKIKDLLPIFKGTLSGRSGSRLYGISDEITSPCSQHIVTAQIERLPLQSVSVSFQSLMS